MRSGSQFDLNSPGAGNVRDFLDYARFAYIVEDRFE
jgi:hypothetical protein